MPMNDLLRRVVPDSQPAWLDGAGFGPLLDLLSEGMRIRHRDQFYLWTQGPLQALLPHGVMVCGLARGSGTPMFFDYFYNVPLLPASLSKLCHPRHGLAALMLETWLAQGSEPLSFTANARSPASARITEQLVGLGLGDTLVHGIPSGQSSVGACCFFGFLSILRIPQPRDLELVQVLVPLAFSAYSRAVMRDRPPLPDEGAQDPEVVVTDREVEILRWVQEGKSNYEIGMILSISPLTVKNHVQKILRKLRASNRAQAVSKAIALRLLGGMTGSDHMASKG